MKQNLIRTEFDLVKKIVLHCKGTKIVQHILFCCYMTRTVAVRKAPSLIRTAVDSLFFCKMAGPG